METTQARDIIRALSDGRDPVTNTPFPPNSPYQQADTVRALFLALEALNKTPRTKNTAPKEPRPIDPNRPKIGTSWTPDEEEKLQVAFAAHTPIADIAAAHGRTPGAITSRLVKLGLIEDTQHTRTGQGNRPGQSVSATPSRRSPDDWRREAPQAGAKTSPTPIPTPPDCPF